MSRTDVATQPRPEAPPTMGSARPRWGLLLAVGVVVSLAAAAPFIPYASDIAWQSFVADRLLAGERLYVDIGAGDVHPPLYTWIATLVASLGRGVGAPTPALLLGLTALAALASTWVSHRWAEERDGLGLLAFGVATLAPFAGYFAGGEHWTAVALLPHLVATARAAAGRPLKRRSALAAAAAAAVGIALKPNFLLVWLATEAYLAWRRRSRRSLVRAENRLMIVLWLLYVAATAWITPEFYTTALWAADLYRDFAARPLASLLTSKATLFVLACAMGVLVLGRRRERNDLALVLLLAAVAMWAAAVSQMKGWAYHWMPATGLAAAALLAAVPAGARRWAVAPAAALALGWFALNVYRLELTYRLGEAVLPPMREVVERLAPRQPILVLSNQLVVGFPLVNLTGAEWSSPYGHIWMAGPLHREERRSGAPYRYRGPAEWSPVEHAVFDGLWRGVQRRPPALVILDFGRPNGLDLVAFFTADPRLRRLLDGFRPAAQVGRYLVLERAEVRAGAGTATD
ncbi:MAG TPA: hypothetical protein VFQ38_08355 [Longimicrobiales bacterium]|nr:hypothetical protein [Longimicrobiales bacterium]